MKKIYASVYNFFIILKVFCPIISFIYALLWLIGFANLPWYTSVSGPFEPLAHIANEILPITINYEDRIINMSYITCSGFFIVLHYIFGFFAQSIVELYNFQETLLLRKRSKDVKKINAILEKEFDKEMERYSSFSILFNIELQAGYDNSKDRKEEFIFLKKEFYKYVMDGVKQKYKNSKGIISDKMFLICENFRNFDDFMSHFSDKIRDFKDECAQNDIQVEFSISVDAIKSNANVYKAMESLEQIESFNYKNKIIATSAFKLRYEKMNYHRYKITQLGVSRFFSGPDDYIDFELYNLKSKG